MQEIGLNQIKEVDREVFANLPQYYEMFCRRLELLRGLDEKTGTILTTGSKL